MGALRYLERSPGYWVADAFADLDYVQKTHGVEVYIVDSSSWVRWNAYLGKWQTMVMGTEPSAGTLPS